MDGWSIPVASAHGEGRAVFNNSNDMDTLKANNQISLQFIHSQDQPTETYPLNPNGSPEGLLENRLDLKDRFQLADLENE